MTPPPDQPVSEPTVEQRHRDAAADYARDRRSCHAVYRLAMRQGKKDDDPLSQAFARFERDLLTRPTTEGLAAELAALGSPIVGGGRAYSFDDAQKLIDLLPRILTALSRPAPETTASDDVVEAFKLWFFRDILDDQRRMLISLALGAGVALECNNHGRQQHALRLILANLPKPTEQATSPAPDAVLREIEQPSEPGGFVGDIFFGHPEYSTMGTHKWNGHCWERLRSEVEVLCDLLAAARNERNNLRARIDAALASSKPAGCEGEAKR